LGGREARGRKGEKGNGAEEQGKGEEAREQSDLVTISTYSTFT